MSIIETPRNLCEKTLACLILDRSGSMEGAPINELNAGIREFLVEIDDDPTLHNGLEVAMVVFDDQVDVAQAPALVSDIDFSDIKTGGTTAMVDAVRKAIQVVEDRKTYYKRNNISYKRPWIILITDGAPDGDQDVVALASEIDKATKANKFIFIPIGVQGADMAVLNSIAGYSQGRKLLPVMLTGTKFKDFFVWLSASMGAIVSSGNGANVKLQSPDEAGWGSWGTFPTSI